MKYLLIIVLFFVACNPYNRIVKKPPITDSDTLNLSKRCMEAFPVLPKTVIIEKVDTFLDDTKITLLQHQLKSVLILLDSCKDSKGNIINLDSLRASVTKQVQDAYKPTVINKTITKEITVVDSAQVVYWRKTAEKMQQEAAIKDAKIQVLQDEVKKQKERANKFLWWFIGACGLVALYIFGRLKFGIP